MLGCMRPVHFLKPSGGDDLAYINAATMNGARCRLWAGETFRVSAAPSFVEGAELVSSDEHERATISPLANPECDPNDPEVALLKAESIVAAVGTMLTQRASRSEDELHVLTVPLDFGPGVLVAVRTTGGALGQWDDFSNDQQTWADRIEICEIRAIVGNVLKLQRPLRCNHGGPARTGIGASVRRVTSAARHITIRGIRLDASGSTVPVGLLASGMVDSIVDVEVRGFSHAGVLTRRGSAQLEGPRGPAYLRHDGECNRGWKAEATHGSTIEIFSTGDGERFHEVGTIGGIFHCTERSADLILTGKIENGCKAVYMKGAVAFEMRNFVAENCDSTEWWNGRLVHAETIGSGTTYYAASGIEIVGGNPSAGTEQERPHGVQFTNVRVKNCRVPVNNGTQRSLCMIDIWESRGHITIENSGRTSNVITGTQAPYCYGALIFDCFRNHLDIDIIGVEKAIAHIGTWHHYFGHVSVHGLDATNECLVLFENGLIADGTEPGQYVSSVRIEELDLAGDHWSLVSPSDIPGFNAPTDYSWSIYSIGTLKYAGKVTTEVRLAKNLAGLFDENEQPRGLRDGELPQLSYFTAGGKEYRALIVPTDADPKKRATVVTPNSGVPAAQGYYCAIATGPIQHGRVKAGDAVKPDDLLWVEANSTVLTTTPNVLFPAYAIAQSRKAAGIEATVELLRC